MKKLLSIIALFGFVATTMVPTYAAPATGKAVGGGTDNKGEGNAGGVQGGSDRSGKDNAPGQEKKGVTPG